MAAPLWESGGAGLQFGVRLVSYFSPERVQQSTWVRILIAMDAISTGCNRPCAEVVVALKNDCRARDAP
jgi:UDP-N-acetyl-D-mannosaminuronate dehydrogenase